MGANGSYSKDWGGVPTASRTHSEFDGRIDGHKILVQSSNMSQMKIPMNSNSESPLYLCGVVDTKTGIITIKSIGIYKNHKLVGAIDIVTDKNGNLVTYTDGKKSTHYHNWQEDSTGNVGRKSHNKKNTLPVDKKFDGLLNKIVEFNKQGHIWKQKL